MANHNFTGYNEFNANSTEKTHININSSDHLPRLLDILGNLGLVTNELATPLKTIAAAGEPIKEFLQIPVHKLDAKLRNTYSTVEQKIAFKANLDRHGLLVVVR